MLIIHLLTTGPMRGVFSRTSVRGPQSQEGAGKSLKHSVAL